MNQDEKEVDGNQQEPSQKRGANPETIAKRNRRLARLFKLMEMPVKLIGSEDAPELIYDEKFQINAYVKNFDLHFTDKPDGGNTIYSLKLNEAQQFDKNRIMECLFNYPVRYMSKVVLDKVSPPLSLYVVGYDYLNGGVYPVFATCSPLSDEDASNTLDGLKNDGYDCSVTSQEENIKLERTNKTLYLTGYNFLNPEEGIRRYPVFSAHSPKIYFTKEMAQEIADELKCDGYDCGVITEE